LDAGKLAEENRRLHRYLSLFQLKFKRNEQRRTLEGRDLNIEALRTLLLELEDDMDNQEVISALLDSSPSALLTLLREKTRESARYKRDLDSLLSRINERLPSDLRS
jgi:hypothetical protein